MKTSSYSPYYQALRDWLRAQREAKGLSIRDAAVIVGRHHSVIGKMEQDRRRIDVVEFVQYCDALGISAHEGLEVLIRCLQSAKEG